MSRMLTVFLYEFWRNIRRRGYLLTTFGLPVVGIGLFLLINAIGGGSTNTTETVNNAIDSIDLQGLTSAGMVDLSGQMPVPPDLAEAFTSYPDEEAALAALKAGDIDAYFVFAPDYMETGTVTEVMLDLNLFQVSSAPARAVALANLGQSLDENTFQRIVNPATYTVENRAVKDASSSFDTRYVIVYLFAIVLLISLFVTNGYLMQSVIEEKETRLIEILISSVRPIELLSGKIFAMGLLGLGQLLVWILLFLGFTQLLGGNNLQQAVGIVSTFTNFAMPVEILPILVIYFVLAYLMFAALFAGVGALSNSMREGPQYAVLFTLPAVIPLWFLPVFASDPNGPIAVALSLFPLTAPLAMTERLVVAVVPAWQIVLSLIILGITAVGAIWLSARLFRVQTLLSGKLPGIRDLPGLLRGG